MEDHIKSLDILSEWMLEQNLDMSAPDGVLDPAETACSIRHLTAENERLREALKPFADCVVHLHPLYDPEAETLDGIKVREWRAAYAALQPKKGGGEG